MWRVGQECVYSDFEPIGCISDGPYWDRKSRGKGMGVLMFSTVALRAETAELPKSPKEATEMRRARRFMGQHPDKEEKRTRDRALPVTDCWIIKVE